MVKVEVAYALAQRQKIIVVEVQLGMNIEQVITASGILNLFPEINLLTQAVGIFSKIKKLSDGVQAGDRIEIYRPLMHDPKDARRLRAKQKIKK